MDLLDGMNRGEFPTPCVSRSFYRSTYDHRRCGHAASQAHDLLEQPQEPATQTCSSATRKGSDAVRPSSVRGCGWLLEDACPRTPPRLLGSARFTDFLTTLRDHFDWVILDSPPSWP